MHVPTFFAPLLHFLIFTSTTMAAEPDAITVKDEALVPAYTLLDPLKNTHGATIADAASWKAHRPQLQQLLEQEIYGKTLLGRPPQLKWTIRETKPDARAGKATRLRIAIFFEGTETGRQMELLVYLPNHVATGQKVPVLLGLNFDGNYTTVTDADLPVPNHFAMGLFENKLPDHKPVAASRGMHAYMWQLDLLLEAGCGLATAAYGEIEPDENGKWKQGIRGLAPEPKPSDWGAVGAWAWGLSRAMDFLETHDRIDPRKVMVMGFSRLGKAALWAAAQDERFAGLISNGSGAGGMAPHHRIFGETVTHLSSRFPHWFCGNFARHAGKESSMPVDQHQVAALIAPRPILVTSGTEDLWADPKGEFLSLTAAAPVWSLLGLKKPLESTEWPKPGKPTKSPLAYFLREGGHDVTLEDWRAIISFVEKQLKPTPVPHLSQARYAQRLATHPDKAAWQAYFARSDAFSQQQEAHLAAEIKAAGLPSPKRATEGESFELNTDDAAQDQFSNAAGAALAANMLTWQLPHGGWSKEVSYATPRTPGTAWTIQENPWHYAGTFDNRSTTENLLFLARRHEVTPDQTIAAAVERGLDYILAAQMPHGLWPQCYPLEGDYHDNVTLNDNMTTQILSLLQAAAQGEKGFSWLTAERKTALAAAANRGTQALLGLQMSIANMPTVWCPQYDALSLHPTGGRGYEPPALSGGESVEVVRYLFTVRPVTPEIQKSIDAALSWFASHPLTQPTPETAANTQWARFYDLQTQKPIFPGKRDGKLYPTEAAMRKQNPGGYDFTVKKAADLPKWHAKWLKTLAKERGKK